MAYTLKGDRNVEYGFLQRYVPEANGRVALDVGCGPDANGAKMAINRGWSVVGIDLEGCRFAHPRFTFIQADLLEYDFGPIMFDMIINISTMEHFGLSGRYGVAVSNPAADIYGMQKLHKLMNQNALMLLTIPVGVDAVFPPKHRVYGKNRLPTLALNFRTINEAEFYAKQNGVDEYVRVDVSTALNTMPTDNPSYYALGCMRLCRTEDAPLFGEIRW